MAEKADKTDQLYLCSQPDTVPLAMPADLNPARLEAIRLIRNKWVNGTNLHYFLLEDATSHWPEAQKTVVERAFDQWKALGIGLSFTKVARPQDAEVRISFVQNGRSWSYVGTDVLQYPRGATMNFGWDLTTQWGRATALHEIGHTLGMPHEHQNPLSGIVWDEDKVYAEFSSPPNSWDRDTIYRNIIRKLNRSDVEGSNWDPSSIMHYPFKRGLIKAPPPYDTQGVGSNVGLSANDKAWMRRFYPPLANATPISVMELARLNEEPGAQTDLEFVPDASRKYTIRTLGASDLKIVVFEDSSEGPKYLTAYDDSGMEKNAEITTRLLSGHKYIIRVRVHYAETADSIGLIIT